MNLQQLEYFKAVAEFENYTMASEILSITQPALSKAISNLEVELNIALFEKDGRNIKLTRYGNMFLKRVNVALAEINAGIEELRNLTNINDGTIRIASTYSIGSYFIPFIISKFLKKNPDAKFEFYTTSLSEVLKALKDGKIDLGFYEGFNSIEKLSAIKSIPIKKEKYVLIVPKDHKFSQKKQINLNELKAETFVISSECDKNKIVALFKRAGFTPKISIKASQLNLLDGLVGSGAGIAIVPNTPNINTNIVSILDIVEILGERVIYMGFSKESELSPISNSFKESVLDN